MRQAVRQTGGVSRLLPADAFILPTKGERPVNTAEAFRDEMPSGAASEASDAISAVSAARAPLFHAMLSVRYKDAVHGDREKQHAFAGRVLAMTTVAKQDESEALVSEALAAAASGSLTLVRLIETAEQVSHLRESPQVITLYQTWIAANPCDPLCYAALFNLGVVLSQRGDLEDAVAAFREALRKNPDFLAPAINLGTTLERLGRPGEAVEAWHEAASIVAPSSPTLIGWQAEAWKQIGRVLEHSQQDEKAELALGRSLDLDPSQRDAIQHLVASRQAQCKWPPLAPTGRVSPRAMLDAVSPLSLAALSDDPMLQLAAANRYWLGDCQSECRTAGMWPHAGITGRTLHIGYLSSDLREHAIGFLTAELFGIHDRAYFTISAYYCGPVATDSLQARIRNSVDNWVDISSLSDREAATRIVQDQVDILVDLNGYTKDARTRLLALRPAPVIVNWLGFPGSMGTPHHHYIIADAAIVPTEDEIFYSEKIMRLPCYQPNDRARSVAGNTPSRTTVGLPEDAFVFCCFNGQNKITETMFKTWIDILKVVPGSVLWLLSTRDATSERLRCYAEQHGIEKSRIVLAERMRHGDHLARYPLADLFLDSFPYGAHTTASDALWMGVPVLTLSGRTFASRVCGSLVRAAGIPELVASTLEEYVSAAIALANEAATLQAYKTRLVAGRDRSVLFDTPLLVSSLEDLYRTMWRDFCNGTLPRPALHNLPLYHAIGCAGAERGPAGSTIDSLRSWYRMQLTYEAGVSPIPYDDRLWARPEPAGNTSLSHHLMAA